jgi:hypothetical protein
VALVRTDVSEEGIASIIKTKRMLVTANVPSPLILFTLMMETIRSSDTSVLTGATRREIPEEGILPSHRREHLKFYILVLVSASTLPELSSKQNDLCQLYLLGYLLSFMAIF